MLVNGIWCCSGASRPAMIKVGAIGQAVILDVVWLKTYVMSTVHSCVCIGVILCNIAPFVMLYTLQFCNVWCMDYYYEFRTISKVSEDIGLSKPYTTSKAYYQTAFGLRTFIFCLQDNVTVKYFHKLVLIKALFAIALTRNN